MVLSSIGYPFSTLSDVADAAGSQTGTLYYHFSSKDELLHERTSTGERQDLLFTRLMVFAMRNGSINWPSLKRDTPASIAELACHDRGLVSCQVDQ